MTGADAMLEIFQWKDPAEILSRTFEEASDELIVLRGIEFHSICEHHLLPFHGTAAVGYLPGKVVGISKLARLVHCFARRLQIQERLTRQIADAVAEHLDARGVAVVIRAHHLCMGVRGVKLPATEMITSAMLGAFRKAGFDVEPWPVDYRTRGKADLMRPFDKVSEGLRRVDTAMREWVGLLAYWLRGRSDALFPAPLKHDVSG